MHQNPRKRGQASFRLEILANFIWESENGPRSERENMPVPFSPYGTYESLSRHMKRLQFHPIRIVIGKPYRPEIPEGRKEKEMYGPVAQEMMDRVAALG